ncbi:PTS system, cellobiose-specific IIb component [Citrobacter koseri]|uniref:PTS system, cellobiose-specific IIb component n=1 Tax=Citrobacter koseri TaxID=545 RepID=A0A2X2WKT6_CITKO|nr:PTS system, cellobiose-specific IIb component [Citrobacter koseri]
MKNIVLCCAAGMSTSMLVQRMKDAAQKKGVEVSIKAVPVAEFKENIATADIVLLALRSSMNRRNCRRLPTP